jgi:phosphate transport system protein
VNELRSDYHRQLEQIDSGVALELGLIEDTIAAATAAFLDADDEAARTVATRRLEIKSIHASLEALVVTQLACQAPVAGELRHLVAVLRILPEIDLTAALAGDIARRGAMHFGAELSPRIRGLVSNLFEHAAAMWHQAADSYSDQAAINGDSLETQDEEIDEIHASLMAELVSGILRPPVLVEMALVARFLERLGDHAVEVGRWIDSSSCFDGQKGRAKVKHVAPCLGP